MKRILNYSIVIITIILGFISCKDRVDYSPDIAMLKSQVAALKKNNGLIK
jgi:hypothetical protein